MREIKFRVWNDFVDCFEYFTFENILTYQTQLSESLINKRVFEQYTGLKDKDGIEIYENDIMLYDSHGRESENTIIEYINDMFHCKSIKYKNLSPGNFRLATLCDHNAIIGNIHQNKELLK